MRRIVVLLATMVICGWATAGWAAHGWYMGGQVGPQPVAADPAYGAPYAEGCGCGSPDYGYGCQPWGCGADRCGGCGCQHRLAAKKAEAGYFNCRCRGSYKFPVLPQYTYHWPGMYSQQTMTEYSSPYRFPALKHPDEVFGREDEPPYTDQTAGPPVGPTTAISSAEPKKLPNDPGGSKRTPQAPGTTSQRMKRLYGVP